MINEVPESWADCRTEFIIKKPFTIGQRQVKNTLWVFCLSQTPWHIKFSYIHDLPLEMLRTFRSQDDSQPALVIVWTGKTI